MSFRHFHEKWLNQLHDMVEQLNQALKPPSTTDKHHHHRQLVQNVMSHYNEYYRVKSIAIKKDVLSVVSAPWATTFERSLDWIAGWRSTTAFHVIYTESSAKFESQLEDILRGFSFDDLSDLTTEQLNRVSELQVETIQEEDHLTEELSQWQDESSDIVGLCDGTTIDGNMEKLVTILQKADALRLKTIQNLVDLLTPHQAIEFLIAAAQLQFGLRGWGVDHDQSLSLSTK